MYRTPSLMQYLADTDWVISYQRGVAPVVQRLDSLSLAGVGLSIISVAELYDGILGSPDPAGANNHCAISSLWALR